MLLRKREDAIKVKPLHDCGIHSHKGDKNGQGGGGSENTVAKQGTRPDNADNKDT